MKIHFYAHACFRLESDSIAVVTDPYTPGPSASNFAPVDEPADLVIMSSSVDRFHSDPTHINDHPLVIDAVDIPDKGIMFEGMPIRAYQTMESMTFDYGARDAEPNAMYWFELDGVRCLHMGDLGNPVSDEHIEKLRGTVDVLFALTGGQPTIALPDLADAIDAIGPKIVIPMHYYSPRGVLQILPVEEFTNLCPEDMVTYVGGSELQVNAGNLPKTMHIYVLEQSR